MATRRRTAAFWFIVCFLALSIVLLLAGQTLSVIQYDLTVRLGLQESAEQVGAYGVQVNRAFGAGDTIVYIPLILASMIGLWRRRRWALLTTAAVVGISAYWSVTVGCMFLFLPGTPGYENAPGPEIWAFIATYALFGVWGLGYVLTRGERLLR